MILTIVIITYLFIYLMDYKQLKKTQSKLHNTIYLSLFSISFILLVAYIFNWPIPKISTLLKTIIGK